MKAQLYAIFIILFFIAFYLCTFVVQETEQVIITQFGKPVGEPKTEAGLHFKIPFIQEVNRIEKRFLPWNGPSSEMSTKDKTYLIIDTFARWRISEDNVTIYFESLRDERRALSRLDDILGSATRNAVAKHELIEIIRTNKDRVAQTDEALVQGIGKVGTLYPIKIGRGKVEDEIFTNARPKLAKFGIELLDIRFKRINYNETVRRRIYERMVSERQQIAASIFVLKEKVKLPKLLVKKSWISKKSSPRHTRLFRKYTGKQMPRHLQSMRRHTIKVLRLQSFMAF